VSDRIDVNDFTWPEIMSRLARAHVARLAFEALDGPHVALIDVSTDREGRIVFCTGDDPQLDDLDGRTVAIEIDGCDAAIEHGWYITTVGTARTISADAALAALRAHHRDRHQDTVGRWIVVESHAFTGRRERYAAAADGWFAGVPGS
jgi:Pyridoxamine 5'-phosphate oxidase